MKKGDTLIEVALAIGIFSMVAVAVIAVVSGSTSNAQTSLETTITREEIDAQAEALRFIQSAYIAGGRANAANDSSTEKENLQKYADIWDAIAGHAVDLTSASATTAENILRFNPRTCAEIYDGSSDSYIGNAGAFIINTRQIGSANPNDIVISVPVATENRRFYPTTTYPRIIYGPYGGEADIDALLEQSFYTDISRVEGLFIVAVKDPGTVIVSGSSASIDERSAYYDFYIRSCWYNPGSDTPSTISTVIRLQDPTAINYGAADVIAKRLIINYDENPPADVTAEVQGFMPTQSIRSGTSADLLGCGYALEGYRQIGWVSADGSVFYGCRARYTAPGGMAHNQSVTLYARWVKE